MKHLLLLCITVSVFASCSTPKTYFTSSVRSDVEASSVPLTKLQYYVDRDVELRREVSSSNAKVSSGVVRLEHGKYINIITLKKNTPGVCTKAYNDRIDVSFEMGDGRYLTFGKLKRDNYAPYTLYASSWNRDLGEISYDGMQYYILPAGSEAKLMIRKDVLQTIKTEKRKMNGRKVD